MNALVAASAAAVLLLAAPQWASAQERLQFSAEVSGAQEVPPTAPLIPGGVETTATGRAAVVFDRGLASLRYRLSVDGGTGITQAHLHCGRPGQNGPIVVSLFGPADPTDSNGVLAEGSASNANVAATAEGCEAVIGRPVNNMASLAFAAHDGLIYANVHTVNFPAGEIRGQLQDGGAPELERDLARIEEQIGAIGADLQGTRRVFRRGLRDVEDQLGQLPGIVAATADINCGKQTVRLSTGNDQGSCGTRVDEEGKTVGGRCENDQGSQVTEVTCESNGTGTCARTTGSASCTVLNP